MWLMGYNEKGLPLTDEEMKEDVMPEYRNKTCTIEPQTCTGLRNISVHPCRHSLLLKKMIQDFQNSGKKLEVHMSILLFLKFLQSVVPTVQYDYTMDISF
jgi:ubiquitin-like-conjugating enzyme ATG3